MKGRVAIIHPDLGIGGAERLIVDFALALIGSGYRVKIYTSHHDKNRCFQETIDGRIDVETVCEYLPRSTLGLFHALWAYLKVFFIGLHLCVFHSNDYDIFLADQVPSCLPILKLLCYFQGKKMAYYCHFPDMLLTKRESTSKIIYRMFIDSFEGWSTSLADLIMVNSLFTASVVRKTFSQLRKKELVLLYPCVNLKQFEHCKPSLEDCGTEVQALADRLKDDRTFCFLSLNRFEPKKDIALAIKALSETIRIMHDQGGLQIEPHLIIAGGYDDRLEYCVSYLKELQSLVGQLKLESHVTFIKSPNENEKLAVIELCDAVIYTPTEEHFGIVPIEAMAMQRPVIACNSGGPLETVKHEMTGYLSEPAPGSFAKYMLRLMKLPREDLIQMGKSGAEHVRTNFTFDKLQRTVDKIFEPLAQR